MATVSHSRLDEHQNQTAIFSKLKYFCNFNIEYKQIRPTQGLYLIFFKGTIRYWHISEIIVQGMFFGGRRE